MDAIHGTKTIAEVFEEFLADQAKRLRPRTVLKYRTIIDFFTAYLERYWPGHDGDYERITAEGGTYCETFGPEELGFASSEFLGYFMPHKVICGRETLKAAGTVTKKLARWLESTGYIDDTAAMQERSTRAGKELALAQDVLDILQAYLDEAAPDDFSDAIEDHFWIRRIAPGKLWLEAVTAAEGTIGPVPVPRDVTDRCREMWDISGVVVKTRQGFRFREIWNVTPG